MKIVLIDNYDSFSYNIVQYLMEITGEKIDVFRNDKLEIEQLECYDAIVLSPGPGIPDEAGLLKPIIKHYAKSKKILGICLGHQAIGEVFGAKLLNTKTVYHGVSTMIRQTGIESKIFDGIDKVFEVGRYHSWIVDSENLPECLEVTAVDENGRIMALKHKEYDIQGLQFHPESVLTPQGKLMLKNWVKDSNKVKDLQKSVEYLTQRVIQLENQIKTLTK